ncbi:MAG: hypothetical protein F4X98_17325 [Gammaproteobacteria bacterium]|nr:hypothetical protein [Gammaproteobacteria bacterium]
MLAPSRVPAFGTLRRRAPMDISAVQREIESALRREGLSRAAASRLAQGNPSLVKNIMNGHAPRLDSLARLAEVLNLDLYFGPPRNTPAPAETAATPADRPVPGPAAPDPDAHDVLAAIRALNRVVHALGPTAGRAPTAPARAAADGDRLHAVGDRWFRDDWMRRRGLDPSVCRLAEVTGSAMEPTLPDGTVVLVDRADRDPQPMSVYLLRLVDGQRVRRLGLEGNRWRMLGDHPRCPPIDLPDNARIVGRVAWSAREHPADGRDGLLSAGCGNRR